MVTTSAVLLPLRNTLKVAWSLSTQLVPGTMSAPTKTALADYLAAVPLHEQSVREAIGLAVASPDFQYY